MNDQDYIRKAVELADGWSWQGEIYLGRTDDPLIMVNTSAGVMLESDERMALDALAAQLVRQVDTKMGVSIQIVSGSAHIKVVIFSRNPDRETAQAFGPDRTMNTIKAIVDSGVLSE